MSPKDRIAILAKGELICEGTMDELLGANSEHYQVKGKGGSQQILQDWVADLDFQAGQWHGRLQGDAEEFLRSLSAVDATLLKMDLVRPSLEDFFIRQLRQEEISA